MGVIMHRLLAYLLHTGPELKGQVLDIELTGETLPQSAKDVWAFCAVLEYRVYRDDIYCAGNRPHMASGDALGLPDVAAKVLQIQALRRGPQQDVDRCSEKASRRRRDQQRDSHEGRGAGPEDPHGHRVRCVFPCHRRGQYSLRRGRYPVAPLGSPVISVEEGRT
jgi:hypothetical protein